MADLRWLQQEREELKQRIAERQRLASKRKHGDGDGEGSGKAQITFEERRGQEQRRYRRVDLWHGGGATCKQLGEARAPTALSATVSSSDIISSSSSSSSSGGGGGGSSSGSSINTNALGAAQPQYTEGVVAGTAGGWVRRPGRKQRGKGAQQRNQHKHATREVRHE